MRSLRSLYRDLQKVSRSSQFGSTGTISKFGSKTLYKRMPKKRRRLVKRIFVAGIGLLTLYKARQYFNNHYRTKFGENKLSDDDTKTLEKIMKSLNSKILYFKGKNAKTYFKGIGSRIIGGSGGEAVQELNSMKRYILEKYILPFENILTNLEKQKSENNFGNIGDILYAPISMKKAKDCKEGLEKTKEEFLQKLIDIDKRVSKLEGKEPSITKEIYNRESTTFQKYLKVSGTLNLEPGAICRTDVYKTKVILFETLKDIGNRIKVLVNGKTNFGSIRTRYTNLSPNKKKWVRRLGYTGGALSTIFLANKLGNYQGSTREKVDYAKHKPKRKENTFGTHFIKRLGQGMWNNKGKILGVGAVSLFAYYGGREKGRIKRFKKQASPEEKKEFEDFLKECDTFKKINKRNPTDNEYNEIIKKYPGAESLSIQYMRTYHPRIVLSSPHYE